MAESMKFGPEWLRNMSQDGNPSSSMAGSTLPPVPKYLLAEYRYGREEMLALFIEASIHNPSNLSVASLEPSLYSESVQMPLAFIQMSEEETRNYNRGFNSRSFSAPSMSTTESIGKPFSTKLATPVPNSSSPAPPGNTFRNRNTGFERGRGRGAPGNGFVHLSSRTIKENSENYSVNRTRGFAHSSMDLSTGRGWSDRNGIIESDSKKETLYNRAQNASDSNWRRFREDEDPWRPNYNRTNSAGNGDKWGLGSRGSWRIQAEQSSRLEREDEKWERGGGSKWEDNKNLNRQRRYSSNEDNLPEWAMENLSETRGGTFDSDGAYHGNSDEENEHFNYTPNKDSNNIGKHEPNLNEKQYYRTNSEENNVAKIYPDSSNSPLTDASSPTKFIEESSPSNNLETNSSIPSSPHVKATPASPIFNKDTQEKPVELPNMSNNSSPIHKHMVLDAHRVDELMNQRMSKVVDDIDRLMNEEEQQHKHEPIINLVDINVKDKWLYKDPQGAVQGPFTSAEMAEWYRSGYFRTNLLVRRLCDEQFSPLGDLFHFYGNVPFLVDNSLPPIKASDHIESQNTKPIDEALLIQHFRDMQLKRAVLSQQQQILHNVVKSLQQMDNWSNLSNAEQQSLISQNMDHILHTNNVAAVFHNQNATPAPINIPASNPIMQLVAEMQRNNIEEQQQQTQPQPQQTPHQQHQHNAFSHHVPQQPQHIIHPNPTGVSHPNFDNLPQPPVRMSMANHIQEHQNTNHIVEQSNLSNNTDQNSSFQLFLRQVLAARQNQPLPPMSHPLPPPLLSHQPPQMQQPLPQPLRVWGPPIDNEFPHPNPNNFTHQLPPRTEAEHPSGAQPHRGESQFDQFVRLLLENGVGPSDNLVENQHHKIEEDKRAPTPVEKPVVSESKREEIIQSVEKVEEKKKKKEDFVNEGKKLKENKEKEEALQKQEEKKEMERKKKEEEKRRKTEEQKKKKEEKEKLKKQEEERKKLAEEEKKAEEQKKREKEERRKIEQQRQEEALRKLEEQQKREKNSNKTWTTNNAQSVFQPTLADIQKTEKEHKQQQIKQQQTKQQKIQPVQNGNNAKQNESTSNVNNSKLNLGWAKNKPAPVKTKSIAEIQAEQTEQLAKQLEKEKKEKLANTRAQAIESSNKSAIWGGSAYVSNYAQASSKSINNNVKGPSLKSNAVVSNPVSGFWDDPGSSVISNNTAKLVTSKKVVKNTTNSKTNVGSSNSSSTNSHNTKCKAEDKIIKDIFTSSALKESSSNDVKFINWCSNSLTSMKINDLDIPTFIGFLKDIESPKDIRDYVKLYIGEGKQAINFANQYLEKRKNINQPDSNASCDFKTKSSPKSKSHNDDKAMKMTAEFIEVKAKSKKKQKGKMRHIDTTLLGFSVTAPPDRFNVGEREFPE